MSRYRKVDQRMWADAKFLSLGDRAKLLWVYLLTGTSTTSLPGVIVAGRAQIAEHLGWSPEVFAEAFGEVFRKGMAKADWEARVVFLPRASRYASPESPNVIRGWRTLWDEVPECALKCEAYHALKAFAEALPEAFRKAFGEALPQPSPNQEQEQEQEQEQDPQSVGANSETARGARPTPAKGPKPDVSREGLTGAVLAALASLEADESLSPIVKRPAALCVDLVKAGPGVDVAADVRAAGAWLRANPKRAKSNGNAFLVGWVQRSQERASRGPQAATRPPWKPPVQPMSDAWAPNTGEYEDLPEGRIF